MINAYHFARDLAAALILFVLCGFAPAAAKEWRVQPGMQPSAVVAAARAGDVVIIERGYYEDRLLVDKRLTVRGENRPTLSGMGEGDVIRVTAPDVVIEGLIVRDSGANLTQQNAGIYVQPGAHRAIIRHNDVVYCLFGMWIELAHDVLVEENLVTGMRDLSSSRRGNGIQLYNTERARIIGNNISFTRDGIYVDVSHHALFRGNRMHHLRYGTHYMNSYFNTWEKNESYLNRSGLALMEVKNQIVRDNLAWGNTDHGIMLRTIQDAEVYGNVVAGNGKGFFIYDAEYNVIRDNLVVGNRIGAHLWAGSINNEFEGNDFINNRDQVRYVASRDQRWGTKRGNYWSNYIGWDRDGNGVGDVEYEANDVVDRLTWRYPYTKLLFNSPAVQALRVVARQFPLLRAPSIVDARPRMQPYQPEWSQWLEKIRH